MLLSSHSEGVANKSFLKADIRIFKFLIIFLQLSFASIYLNNTESVISTQYLNNTESVISTRYLNNTESVISTRYLNNTESVISTRYLNNTRSITSKVANPTGLNNSVLFPFSKGSTGVASNFSKVALKGGIRMDVATPTCQASIVTSLAVMSYGSTINNYTDYVNIISEYDNWLSDYSTRNSFFYESNNQVYAYLWVGSAIENSLVASNTFSNILEYIISNTLYETCIFQYYDGIANNMFGLAISLNGDIDFVQNAVKYWSMGQEYSPSNPVMTDLDEIDNCKICYYSEYSNYKSGNYDSEAGECFYAILNSGQTLDQACNITGYNSNGNLSIYNQGSVLTTDIEPNQAFCCSTGSYPNPCNNEPTNTRYFESIMGYSNANPAISNIDDVLDLIMDIMFALTSSDQPIFYEQNGDLICGSWLGQNINNEGSISTFIFDAYNNFESEGMQNTKYFQIIDSLNRPENTIGLICDSTGDKQAVLNALKTWSSGKSYNVNDGTETIDTDWAVCYQESSKGTYNGSLNSLIGTCNYNTITSGQSATSTCNSGISTDTLISYNSEISNINEVAINDPICCSVGLEPNFMKSPYSNGTCYTYLVQSGDTCENIIAANFPMTLNDLNEFNKNTYSWLGCGTNFDAGTKICLSSGNPPRPNPDPEAECGPLAPGDLFNTTCPLNACCDQWGFCGLTSEFCQINSSVTNAPGTTGCYSDCGYGQFTFNEVTTFKNITYWMNSSSMPLEINLLDGLYDSIHYAFLNINDDLSGFDINTLELSGFLNLKYSNKIISFGGWNFSTDPNSYEIFRTGVQPDNVDNFVDLFVNFANNYNISGLDFDWEYPGEPDIPGIPADSVENAQYYLIFIQKLRSALPNNLSLSMAIPASYWYLKPFPITEMENYVDYFVFMTYDFHGEWDYDNKWDGGDNTQCHTDFSDTFNALQMLMKAGVNPQKVYVGLANYARSYQVPAGCDIYDCPFAGPVNLALPGHYSNVSGMLTFDDINYIKSTYTDVILNEDSSSECTIMLYDNNQWAAWSTNNDERSETYKELGFGGISLWVANYQFNTFNNELNYVQNESSLWDLYNDYAGTKEYINLWNCKYDSTIQSLNDVDNQDPMCRIEAIISYNINAGKNAYNNLTYYIDNINTYNEYYNIYIGFYQSYLMTLYSNWAIANPKYFDPPISVSMCDEGSTGSTTLDLVVSAITLNSIQNLPPTKPQVFSIENTIMIGNRTEAAQSLSTFMNLTIQSSDLVDYASSSTLNFTYNYCDRSLWTNSTIPEMLLILPNPLVNVTSNDLYNITLLYEKAQNLIGNSDPTAILDILTPVMVFSTNANTTENIYNTGKEILQFEREEILDTILMFFGIASIFVDGWAAIAINTIMDAANLFAGLIMGDDNIQDFATIALDLFGPLMSKITTPIENTFGDLAEDLSSTIRSTNRYLKNEENLSSFSFVKNSFSKRKEGFDTCKKD